MKKQRITAVMAALVLGASSLSAFAQPGQHGSQGQGHGAQKKQPKGPQHTQPARQHQAPAPHYQAQPQHPAHPHGMPPGHAKRMGAGPNHNWVKGSRVPPQYRSHQYVVNDWRGHGLKHPPRGYHWVQYGGDYLLVAIASGVIAQLILGN